MSTSAVYFIGRGKNATCVAAHAGEGNPRLGNEKRGVPKEVLLARNESEYMACLKRHIGGMTFEAILSGNRTRRTRTQISLEGTATPGTCEPWNKPFDPSAIRWRDAGGYSYVYALFDGNVWVTQGGMWFNPHLSHIKAPSRPPASPVFHKSTIEWTGHAIVTCPSCSSGSANGVCRVTAQELIALAGEDATFRGAENYFRSKGFVNHPQLGWLCPDCAKKRRFG